MLILTPDVPTAPAEPRLHYVAGELERMFRPAPGVGLTYKGRARRPHRADPESRRNDFIAMCRRCDWQRPDCPNSMRATELAQAHERDKHGVLDGGLVRVECR